MNLLAPDADVLIPFAIGFTLVAVRVAFLLISSPIFGSRLIPRNILAAAIVVVSFAAYMGLPEHRPPPLEAIPIAIAIAGEAALGAAAGLTARIMFAAVEGAGQMIGVPMGLGFANMVDPMSDTATVVTARFMGIAVSLVFLSLDGHLALLRMVIGSFAAIPPGEVVLSGEVGLKLAAKTGMIFESGLQLAAPVMIVLIGVTIALGLLARVAPKVNLFVLSFAVSIGVGILTLQAALPDMLAYTRGLTTRLEPMLDEILRSFAG
jgi:flagellar biosynthesis protein FliR